MEKTGGAEIPEKYADIVREMCRKVACMSPPYPFRLYVNVRPLGSFLQIGKEMPFHLFLRNRAHAECLLREEIVFLLESAEQSFPGKTLKIELKTEKDEVIMQIARNFSLYVRAVIQGPPPPPPPLGNPIEPPAPPLPIDPESTVSPRFKPEQAPEPVVPKEVKTEPVPQQKPEEPNSEPTPESAPEEPNSRPEALPGSHPPPSPETENPGNHHNPSSPINYAGMKNYPTDGTVPLIKRLFESMDIETGQDVLDLLETRSPTHVDWGIFIKKLKKQALEKELSFGPRCEDTLYFWLVKKMGWISKISR